MTSTQFRSSEHAEQVALCQWWAWAYKAFGLPEFALFAIPNGGLRSKAVAGKLKAEGVRAGILDLFLAAPRHGMHGLCIEMKVGKNRPSKQQEEVMAYLKKQGYGVQVCYGAVDAISVITLYLTGGAK